MPAFLTGIFFIRFFGEDNEKTRKWVELGFRINIFPIIFNNLLKIIFVSQEVRAAQDNNAKFNEFLKEMEVEVKEPPTDSEMHKKIILESIQSLILQLFF